MNDHFDVLICGGGLAGLCLARQLRREFPDISVAVIEKTARPLPEAAHKVGESSVELGSHYLERLGLYDYLRERQLIKFGLRFFPGGGHRPIESRTEIGPINDPIVCSYQLDRGRFESDLRHMIETEDGATLIEGASVKDFVIGPGEQHHEVTVLRGAETLNFTCRWLVDASGRAALLRGRMKLKRGGGHEANAGWYRVKGRINITEMAAPSAERWRQVPGADRRWLSTNHLMGPGYWAWVIPLASGTTSIGVVTHDSVHPFDEVRTLERVQAFLEKNEPKLAEFLKDAEVLDFGCLKNYCYTVARCWHSDRWALVGEAGAFADPLYSPGTDYIAFANSFTTELIRTDREGGDLETRTRELNVQYRALVAGAIGVYRHAAPVYGHVRAMATKVYWDNLVYWSYPCQYFVQNIYRLTGDEHERFANLGARFVELSGRMQRLLSEWAERTAKDPEPENPEGAMLAIPSFPSVLVDAHCAVGRSMSKDETYAYMEARLQDAEALFSEILLRVLQELGPERGAAVWQAVEASTWGVSVPPERLQAESLDSRARRQALPPIARELERVIGRPVARWSPQEAVRFITLGTTSAAEAG